MPGLLCGNVNTVCSKQITSVQTMAKKILFIGGSLNQTTILHSIAAHLTECECYFSPFYCDGVLRYAQKKGLLDFTPLGGRHRQMTFDFLQAAGAAIDERGLLHDYDLVVTSSDLIVQKNIRKKKLILVQEGMTDPENFMYYLVRGLGLPRFLASTSTTGLSLAYDRFCVASEGYREFFVRKGIPAHRIVVTGLPNFDNLIQFTQNDFPYRDYVLVATSDARETMKMDNRIRFLKRSVRLADGRPMIFKLHPNENRERAQKEIARYAPDARVIATGDIRPMIANCAALITQYSTVVYVGLALGKEVHSYFDLQTLKRLAPIQNGGQSGRHIATVCRSLLDAPKFFPLTGRARFANTLSRISRRLAL